MYAILRPVPHPNPEFGVQVRFLGEALLVQTHWVDNATMPCLGPACLYCPEAQYTRRAARYYCPCQAGIRRNITTGQLVLEPWIAELHQGVMAKLEGPLRGLVARLWRPARGKPLALVVLRTEDPATLPPAFDVRPHLVRLWNVRTWPGALEPPAADPAILRFERKTS